MLNNWVSEFITAITYLSESLYILSALSTLFGRYVRYIRLRYYIITCAVTHSLERRLVNLPRFRYSVAHGSPLCFTHVRMEHAVRTSEETMGIAAGSNWSTKVVNLFIQVPKDELNAFNIQKETKS